MENPELRAVFEKRLESMEGVTDTSQEAPIKHMLAPITAAEIASARGHDGAVPKPVSPRVQPYSEEQILSCVRAIARALPAREVWLVGSIARNDGDDGSDVDLLVVLPDDHKCERPTYEALLALIRARTSVPTDVIVITESEKRDPASPLVEDALREGRRLL
jgi:predicted nucleotidyltransferase